MGELISIDFSQSPRQHLPLWPEGDVDNVVSMEKKRRQFAKEKSEDNPRFTPEDLQKLEYFARLLDFPGDTYTTINTHHEGVVVPDKFKGQTALYLSWSYKSGITDFQFDQWGVRGGMAFGGQIFFVEIPWSAVWQVFKKDDPGGSLQIWKVAESELKDEDA